VTTPGSLLRDYESKRIAKRCYARPKIPGLSGSREARRYGAIDNPTDDLQSVSADDTMSKAKSATVKP
jgi:hypothetical protein